MFSETHPACIGELFGRIFLPAAGQKNRAIRSNSSESADALPAGFPLLSHCAAAAQKQFPGIAAGNSGAWF
jgi:hypothetical protein